MKTDSAVLNTGLSGIKRLYDDYGAMLLGYLIQVTGDKSVAEDYLAKIFNSLVQNFTEIDWDNGSTWCILQRYAKDQLSEFNKNAVNRNPAVGNFTIPDNLNEMTEQQRLVFCSIYYGKKTTAQLAAELNQPEDFVRKLLKEAFSVIRRVE